MPVAIFQFFEDLDDNPRPRRRLPVEELEEICDESIGCRAFAVGFFFGVVLFVQLYMVVWSFTTGARPH